MKQQKRIAVIGSGISGLGASLHLAADHQVTLFEADARAGGHAHSVDVTLDQITHPVDTGFLVFNHKTYPHLVKLFERLGVQTSASEMSFAVSVGPQRIEWAGTSIDSLFAQRSNIVSLAHWRMIADLLRFNRQATQIATQLERTGQAHPDAPLLLREYLNKYGYSQAFCHRYLLPMAAAIWSSPISETLSFPIKTFAQFCHNHGLLQIFGRPQWYTVTNGSRSYVNAVLSKLTDVRLSTPVMQVRQGPLGSIVQAKDGTHTFDAVIFACHSDQALALLGDATAQEHQVLSQVKYQPNIAWLHTDATLMPKRKRAWAAWNYLSQDNADHEPSVCVTYWLNRLQPLPFKQQVFVTLNPPHPPAAACVLGRYDYSHPLLGNEAVAAQQTLASIQGTNGRWFAGAWTGFGFHEDGLSSGLAAATAVRQALEQPHAS
jgi:uncharacterized protein